MRYIYKIEVECFKFDKNGYYWYLWCRQANDADASWFIYLNGYADTISQAFKDAHKSQKALERSIERELDY